MIYFATVNYTVKILVIRFSSIGDIVLTTPVVRCLKKQLEGDVEIHYLTKKVFASLLESNPYVSKIHSIEKSTNEVISQLKSENFDYVIDLHKNYRSSRVKRALKVFSFTFDKLNLKKWLLVNLNINRLPDMHIVDRYMAAVSALGIKNDEQGLDHFLPISTKKYPLPESFAKGYIVLVLGANHATKRIPFEKLKEILNSFDQQVVLVGGKTDREMGEKVKNLHPERIVNTAGETSLNESALLIKNSKAVITPDTGMMHIAAAFKKKIVSIWGNTVPEFGMYPYLPKEKKELFSTVEVKGLSCRPCSKIGFDKCPEKHFNCMNQINPQEVVSQLK